MDQHRFEQTFRHIVKRLNNLNGEARVAGDLRPVPVTSERKDKGDAGQRRAGRKDA